MGPILAQVALGGALGAVARYLTQAAALRLFGPALPLGTLAANVVGSFAIGVLFVLLADRGLMRVAPFLMAGVLGGYTTFSAFALDTLLMWERGQPGLALAYVGGTVALTLAAVAAGAAFARGVLT
jgi:CrcB protein